MDEKDVRKMFRGMDRNADGQIDENELKKGLKDLHLPINQVIYFTPIHYHQYHYH